MDENFISDSGFKVAWYETTSMDETLVGSPSDIVDLTVISGDFTFYQQTMLEISNTVRHS